MSLVLEELPGTVCHIDDVLTWGMAQEEHHERLENHSESGRRDLNRTQVNFLGHRISVSCMIYIFFLSIPILFRFFQSQTLFKLHTSVASLLTHILGYFSYITCRIVYSVSWHLSKQLQRVFKPRRPKNTGRIASTVGLFGLIRNAMLRIVTLLI